MTRQRVVVTGTGCVTALGHDVTSTWAALLKSESAIAPCEVTLMGNTRVWPGAPVRGWDPAKYFDANDRILLDPFAQYAVVAAREAMSNAGLDSAPPGLDHDETAVIIGTGGGGEAARQQAAIRLMGEGKKRLHPMLVPKANAQAAAGAISMRYRCRGPSFAVSSGCASGTHAIAQAAMMVRSGVTRRAITGGSEAQFLFSVLTAFEAVKVLAQQSCRPFDRDRDGMVLGEGAGILVLERLEDALERGAPILAELASEGMSADARDPVAPDPAGAALAMRRALRAAGATPAQVGYINAHGTGTINNDQSEAAAIRAVFESHGATVPVSSTKSAHGHVFGGTGAIEAIACIQALRTGLVPPTVNHERTAEDCPINVVSRAGTEVQGDLALSNSFAFGGLNAALLFRRYRQ